jgi:gliding motility-associated-like protein
MGTGCIADTQKNVWVRKLPMAEFTAEPAACADSTEFIEDSFSDNSIAQWRWYFGDSNSQIINAPNDPDTKHLYPPFLNTYVASLAVTDDFGCVDSISQNIQRYPCIFVNFVTDTNIYCQSKAVTFIDSSIVSEESVILTRYWNFGDGAELTTGSTTDTVTHIYQNTGTYEVTYIINFDVNGEPLSDTARKTITVYPTPIAAIGAQNVCDLEEALLISNTAANNSIVNHWTWYFGDGTDTTIINNEVNNAVRHTYPQAGAYDLSLVAVTDLGCRDTAQMNFVVNPVPQIGFKADTTEICGPNTILFTDTSTMESGAIVRRAWSFGDFTDATTTADTISHFYSPEDSDNSSFYTITLTAITDSACRATDSIVEMIAQYALPRPAFRVDPDSIAITELETMIVTNESENAYYFEWLMADSLLYTDNFEPNIWEDIQDTGNYKIQLYAQTVEGCWDSTESYFKVYPVFRFFIPNAFSPNGNGVNEYFGPKGKYFEDKSYSFQIYTRWGEQVFETTDFGTQWDGRHQKSGELQPIGVYAWVIEVTDLNGNIEKFSGFVTLIL